MRKLIAILALLVLSLPAFSQSTIVAGKQVAIKRTSSGDTSAYLYLPWDYFNNSNKYPLLVFFEGSGETGNGGADLPKMLNNGIPQMISQGIVPYAVKSNGDTVKFIIFSPQYPSGNPMGNFTNWWNSLKSYYNLRIDTTRVYFTGLSLGATSVQNVMAYQYPPITFHVAAAISMSPNQATFGSQAPYWDGTPAWFFNGDNDATIGNKGIDAWRYLHNYYPEQDYRITVYPGGHCCWNTYFDPTWKSNDTSVYDFLIQYSSVAELEPPVVNAGTDQTLTSGTTSATLSGSATTSNGSITSYQWTTTSNATITSPASATTTVTGLQDGQSYTFTLTATDDSSETGSDDIVVKVGQVTEPIDTPSYRIMLSNGTKFWKGDTVFYQMNDINLDGHTKNLIDEQDSETPTTKFEDDPQTPGKMVAVIDLGGYYHITSFRLYRSFGTARLAAWPGEPYNWRADSINLSTGAGISGWKSYDSSCYTRYLKVQWVSSGNQNLTEIQLYGYLVKDSLSRTQPADDGITYTENTMGDFMGFNQVVPSEVDSAGELMRHYVSTFWVDTATSTHNIDDIKFVINKFTDWLDPYSPTYYFFPNAPGIDPVKTSYPLTWGEYFDCFQGPPQYLLGTTLYKPIDTAIFHDRDPLNPHQYTRLARMMWTYAAMMGQNAYPEDSMQTPYPQLSGLDKRHYVENSNEYNGSWKTDDSHFTPQEYAAYASAFYDGNKNTMGPRMGVKNADYDMQVVMGGTAGADTSYLKMIHYAEYYAIKGKTSDITNFHTYATSGSNGTGDDPHAFSPEIYFGRGQIAAYMKVAKTVMPDRPVWLTEWGYDRNGRSSLSVPPVTGLDSAQVQAQWIARWWFMLSFSGIDRSTIFQMHNDALSTEYDTTGYTVFNTTGLTDGHYVGNQYSAQNATSYYAYPAYYFQRTIWLRLYNYRPDSIIYQNDDSLYVYRYRNVNSPDNVAYVYWSGTQTNKKLSNYSIKTGHANTQVNTVTLADKQFLGLDTTKTSDADGEIPLFITETPQMMFTTEGVGGGELVSNGTPVNNPPVANAGADQSLTYTATTTTLTGSGTDDGTITGYAWTQVSGPTATISSPSTATTGITDLTSGNTYVFKLTVTDDGGATGEDQVSVVVASAPVLEPPVANAGNDQALSTGTTSTVLSGSATPGSGTITTYTWSKVGSNGATIVSPNSQNTNITGLVDGSTYTFRLTVTDSNGLSDTDDVSVIVDAASGSDVYKLLLYIKDGKLIKVKVNQ